MIRLVHASDIHLGEDGFVDMGVPPDRAERAMKALVDLCIESSAQLLLIAGDLFDNNRVDDAVVDFSLTEMRRAGVPVVVLPGNHDCLVPDSVYHRVCHAASPPGVCVFTAAEGEQFSFPELDLAVWGKPITWYGGALRPLAGVPPRSGEKWQIAVAHGHYVGTEGGQSYSLQISLQEILSTRRDYVALGHWDFFSCVCQKGVKACYAGSAITSGTAAVVDFSDHLGVRVRPQRLPC